MSDPTFHSIRLHGPWQVQILQQEAGAPQPEPLSCRLPGDWTAPLGPEFKGTVQLQRHFNRPTGLQAGQPVYLVVEMAPLPGQVRLNDHVLVSAGPAERLRSDISGWLVERNHLTIDVELPGHPPAAEAAVLAAAEIRLEIAE